MLPTNLDGKDNPIYEKTTNHQSVSSVYFATKFRCQQLNTSLVVVHTAAVACYVFAAVCLDSYHFVYRSVKIGNNYVRSVVNRLVSRNIRLVLVESFIHRYN
jgi:hypothetical protein